MRNIALTLESQVIRFLRRSLRAGTLGIWVPYGTRYHALHQCTKARAGESLLDSRAVAAWGHAAATGEGAMGMPVLGTAGTEKGPRTAMREAQPTSSTHEAEYREQILKTTGGWV